MPKETTNDSSAAASLPTVFAIQAAGAFTIAPYLATAAGAFSPTSAQASVRRAPTSGTCASLGGGGGTMKVWACSPDTIAVRDEASDVAIIAVGATIPTT